MQCIGLLGVDQTLESISANDLNDDTRMPTLTGDVHLAIELLLDQLARSASNNQPCECDLTAWDEQASYTLPTHRAQGREWKGTTNAK